ncbi:MAG: glycosyltransferase, partial [Gammaproteobacteria bacterium]|nr:glycosyltransferase [Gammaproteobacteria bacterium]
EIPRLYARAEEGFDVVLAKRKEKQLSLFRRLSARGYFFLIGLITGRKLEGEYGSFSMISRKVVDAFLRVGDIERHYLFVLEWLGFETGFIEYQHAPRHQGQSAYALGRLLKHALSGLFFQTTVLLRWIIYFGFAVSFLGVLLAIVIVYVWMFYEPPPGWASLAVLVLVLGGAILTSTGITGLYIGRTFEQSKNRPLFVVDRTTEDQVD